MALMEKDKKNTQIDAAELAFKLYPFSSDSVRNAFITGYNKAKEMECVLLCAKEQRSIELPSDEEIGKEASVRHYGTNFKNVFASGATWMRNKIQGNKE
jgi:hypothetical protein